MVAGLLQAAVRIDAGARRSRRADAVRCVHRLRAGLARGCAGALPAPAVHRPGPAGTAGRPGAAQSLRVPAALGQPADAAPMAPTRRLPEIRSEEHTSELQSIMRISYAAFCLK